MTQYLLTFLVGMAGSTLSATCGAGAGLLTSPYCILLGLPPQTAVGTSKFGGIGLAFGSLMRFKSTEHIRWEFVWPFIVVNVTSGIAGICILIFLPPYAVKHIVAYAILLVLPFLFIRKLGIERFTPSKSRRTIGYVLKFLAESAQGGFGAGLGIISSIIVMLFFGFTVIETNATKRIPGLIKEAVTIPWLMFVGIIAYDHGFALVLGSLVGGYIGAHIAIKKGNVFVKIVLTIVVAITAIEILLK